MLNKILFIILLSNFIHAKTITIAVAANVSYAINTLTKEFNKLYPNTKVRVIIGGSGKLCTQIINSAPYELFMSADMKYPSKLYEQKLAITKPIIYAKGSLAFLSIKKEAYEKGIYLLKEKHIQKIAIANPKTAPYGQASIQAIKNANIYKDVQNKFVYGESISQTVSFTLLASNIGIISKSSLFSPKMRNFKKGIHWQEIDSSLYSPINQGLVILKNGKNNQEVLAFYNFLLSSKAKKIFKEFGYIIP